ncbi:MAG: FAD-dependent monooxygenase, partial [Gammaproteobacteria bacterium]|nr:FAD-dependent monooxygenase [Gammaproteobacteria bacterium]
NEHYQCETLTHTPESTKLTFKHKDKPVQVNCKLTIICDGAYSPTRDKAGFTTIKDDYRQTAITANISGKHCNNHIAYERFISTGPMAMLPLNNNRYGLVWSNSAERSEQLMQLNDNEFLQQLQQSFGYRLGKLTQIGTRTSFALKKVLSQQLTLERCVVLGNSAHNLHPVAGQSLNLALRDIAHLYDHITHLDDSTQALVRYEKSRSKDHLQVMQLSDNLVSLFSNNLPVLNHARSAALAALDCLPALKNSIAWRGMGYAQSAASAQRGQLED